MWVANKPSTDQWLYANFMGVSSLRACSMETDADAWAAKIVGAGQKYADWADVSFLMFVLLSSCFLLDPAASLIFFSFSYRFLFVFLPFSSHTLMHFPFKFEQKYPRFSACKPKELVASCNINCRKVDAQCHDNCADLLSNANVTVRSTSFFLSFFFPISNLFFPHFFFLLPSLSFSYSHSLSVFSSFLRTVGSGIMLLKTPQIIMALDPVTLVMEMLFQHHQHRHRMPLLATAAAVCSLIEFWLRT